MVGVGAAVALVIGAGMLAHDASLEDAFLVGVSVAVAAVPEGLAAAVTIALALGAHEMARRGAIVRRLSAVETLGETTVICTDKTGTLTENRLHLGAAVPEPGTSVAELLGAAVLASTATILEGHGDTRIAGDPLEGALLRAAREQGVSREALLEGLQVVEEIPFDSEHRRMAVVYEEPGGARWVVVKGAPEVVIERSVLDAGERERLAELAHSLAEQGARVLAVAERRLPVGAAPEFEADSELVPLGLVALHDPLRPGAASSIREARAGGIEVKMVTGDHPATARAVGRALELPREAVHARISPADKLGLVEGLQGEGEVVAVTGDGVNDAPALRRADVGVAMGRSGTEAAREVSTLVLTDDDFSTIVAAVREGRRISDNIRTFVAFLLSANFGEVVLFGVAVLAGLGAPMTVVQVLTINVLTDGAPAVALSRDSASPDVMRRGPRRGGALFARPTWGVLAAIGVLVGGAGLGAYVLGREIGNGVEQTMAFLTIALAELALAYSIRSPARPAWRGSWNPMLALGVAGSAALALVCVYVPLFQEPFGTVALSRQELGAVVGLALVPAGVLELAKALAPRSAYDVRAGGEAR
jgi:Ca2+-transporting ATPase